MVSFFLKLDCVLEMWNWNNFIQRSFCFSMFPRFLLLIIFSEGENFALFAAIKFLYIFS